MAIKDIVKGICPKTRCKYDVYTKERSDELLNGIVESGNNENGSWVKYADGTMICHANYYFETPITYEWGSLYKSDAYSLKDFPVPFINIPTVDISYVRASWAQYHYHIRDAKQTASNPGMIFLVCPMNREETCGGSVDVVAVGRWK